MGTTGSLPLGSTEAVQARDDRESDKEDGEAWADWRSLGGRVGRTWNGLIQETQGEEGIPDDT